MKNKSKLKNQKNKFCDETEILKLAYQELKDDYYNMSVEVANLNSKKNILALIVSLIMQLFFNVFIPVDSYSSLSIFSLLVLDLSFLILILMPVKIQSIDTSNIYNEIYNEHNQDAKEFLRSSIATYQKINKVNHEKINKCHDSIMILSIAYVLIHVVCYIVLY